MAEPILLLDQVSKSFGALRATERVSLQVLPGEVHALIGPNGAGKTTLISQIAGALQPDGGRIHFMGRDVTGLGVPARAQLGLARVFQISNIVAAFSVFENVLLAAQAMAGSSFSIWRPAGADRLACARAMTALEDVGLAARANAVSGTLSHGEKRALELAMGLVQNPKLLLLDEPMAGTGRQETARLIELLAGLKGRVSMLLVEHDMSAVFALADRITVLVGGAIAASGTPDDVRADPAVRKAYLGEAA